LIIIATRLTADEQVRRHFAAQDAINADACAA
jgi:hypothetical protein